MDIQLSNTRIRVVPMTGPDICLVRLPISEMDTKNRIVERRILLTIDFTLQEFTPFHPNDSLIHPDADL